MSQAVILAGGRGTRLSTVSGDLPKPLVPVDGVPIIERQIRLLVRYGVDEIFLTTGYRADALRERLGDGAGLGVRLHHVVEEAPLGTAGGVAALRGRLTARFLVFYGDVMVHMDLARLLEFHVGAGAEATLVVHPNDHPYDSDLLEVDASGRVLALHPKPRPENGPDLSNLVSAALYVLEPSVLDSIRPDTQQDFVADVFPRMLAAGAPIYAYATTEYLKDMGTPDRLARVEADCRSGLVESLHRDNPRPTAFLDRDGVINEEIDGVHRPQDLCLVEGSAEAIARLNRAGWLCAVVTNQPALAKGFMDETDLAAVHRRLETRLGEARAWLDAITYCPHHPERGFAGERVELKRDCACRKPGTGMLEALCDRLPVDRAESIVVGDSWRDMALAHAFGLDAVGVLSGHGLAAPPPDAHGLAGRPDVVVRDLCEAVGLILDPCPAIDAVADRVVSEHAAGGGSPRLVLIGGRTGSGKSSAAFRLRRALRRRELASVTLRLEDWLLPEARRTPGQSLEVRYRLDRVRAALAALLAGEAVCAPGGDSPPVPYALGDAAVLIVAGVPALLLDTDALPRLRVHVDAASEAVRRERVDAFRGRAARVGLEVDGATADLEEEQARVAGACATADIRMRSADSRTAEPAPARE